MNHLANDIGSRIIILNKNLSKRAKIFDSVSDGNKAGQRFRGRKPCLLTCTTFCLPKSNGEKTNFLGNKIDIWAFAT